MLAHFNLYANLDHLIRHRKGEVKLGEKFIFVNKPSLELLQRHRKKGAKFALMGIPESVGIMANQGEAGAEHAWEQFLEYFSNLQSNRFIDGSNIICLGQVETIDLQQRAADLKTTDSQYHTKLRSMCQELDQRVAPVIEIITQAGLIPIVVGGGHNNAYPILKGVSQGLGYAQGINCINCDAHADFRPLEGRHSGNGFSYAFYKQYLKKYFVLGLHENANSEAMLKNMDLEAGVAYAFRQPGRDPDVSHALKFMEGSDESVGLEIDLDVLAYMPASAFSASGYTMDQIRMTITRIVQKTKPAYLHLTEGQIKDQPREAQIVGRSLATLVLDFIRSYTR